MQYEDVHVSLSWLRFEKKINNLVNLFLILFSVLSVGLITYKINFDKEIHTKDCSYSVYLFREEKNFLENSGNFLLNIPTLSIRDSGNQNHENFLEKYLTRNKCTTPKDIIFGGFVTIIFMIVFIMMGSCLLYLLRLILHSLIFKIFKVSIFSKLNSILFRLFYPRFILLINLNYVVLYMIGLTMLLLFS